MSSSSGWQTNQSAGKLSYNESGWGTPTNNNNLSSPLSHPDNWPKLGGGHDKSNISEEERQHTHQLTANTGNMQQQAEPTGWGPPPSNSASSATGWGAAPQQQQGASGWGGAGNTSKNGWSRQSHIDNGTALWGKQNQSGSGWGAPSTQTSSSSSRSTAQPTNPGNVIPTSQSSNGTPRVDEQNTQALQNPHSSNNTVPAQHPPESWAAAAAAPPAHSHSGQASHPPPPNTAKQSTSESPEAASEQAPQVLEQEKKEPENSMAAPSPSEGEDQVQKLVNSHEGWGKTPIKQNTAWNVSDASNYIGLPPTKTGTEAWGKPPRKPSPGWQGANAQQSPDSNAQQQWGTVTTGNAPVRGWGQITSQSQMPPRPPWGSSQQPNNPPPTPQSGWGDPRLPSPAPMNTNRWNAPNNPLPNSSSQGWGNTTSNVQQQGWNNTSGSGDGNNWNQNVQRNPPQQTPSGNWNAQQQRPEQNWNQPQNMQRQSSTVDDGTSAWGDPNAYKSVNLWDKKSGPAPNASSNETSQNKPETVGWGNPAPSSSNTKPSPTGWGDVNPPKTIDDGTSSWATKTSQGGTNWDQNSGWGVNKPDNSNGWGGNSDNQVPQWGQGDNDSSRVKSNSMGLGFGGMDRKPSNSSDNVFDDGQLERNGIVGDLGGNHGGVGSYSQFPSAPQVSSKMPNLNGPRPVPQQNMMGMQGPFRQPPPQVPPQLQNQYQQIRHAVVSGIIPPHILNPQYMTPQHLSLLQSLLMKATEYQNLNSRLTALNKQMNIPPQVRQHQHEQIMRGLKQLQSQIQVHQRALTNNVMQKQAAEKGNMGGMGPNSGLGLDLPPSSSMPHNNSNMFNMAGMAQNLPNPGNMTARDQQQSRLPSWRRPSTGFDNSSDFNNLGSGLGSLAPQNISEIMANSGLLSPSTDQTNFHGLQQDSRNAEVLSNEMKEMESMMLSDQDQDQNNLKKILAEIGPPEFIPGKKWAGFRPIDPENDPDITPGSVAIAKTMSVNTVKDADQVLNRDRYSMLQNDNTALTDSDLSSKNQPALASSFANISSGNQASSSPSGWSSGSRWMENNKTWMVLTNINPRVDLNTLRNLCNTSGKMISFQPNVVRGMVLVKYQTASDALYIQKTLLASARGANMLSIAFASDQEVGNFFNSGNNWNQNSVGRRPFGSSGTMLSNHPQGPLGYGSGGPMMTNPDMGYPGGDAQNLWSTGDNGSNMMSGHQPSWSTGNNQAHGRPTGMGGMWGGGYENPRVISPPHNLLPGDLLGEQQF